MTRLSTAMAVSLLLASGCLVEATDPPGQRGSGASPDAGLAVADGSPGVDPETRDAAAPDAGEIPTAASKLAEFGKCMRIADWDAANLGQLALVETAADGNCAQCHSAGLSSTYLSADSLATFAQSKTSPYVSRYAAISAALVLSASPDLIVKGQDPGHSSYTLPPALVQGISDFFDATNARLLAGNCDLP